jgi:ribosome recycling factor
MDATTVEEVLLYNDEQCNGAVHAFQRDLAKVRSGRASSGLVEGVQVDYYGARTALEHLAQVSTPEAQLILVQVYDAGAVQAVEKAILESNLGFNPSREGNTLRIIVPPLSEERRKDIIKHLHKMAEDIRISIRNHRREANDCLKRLEKDGEINKDDSKRGLDKVQKQTDDMIAQVDSLLKKKEEEVIEV